MKCRGECRAPLHFLLLQSHFLIPGSRTKRSDEAGGQVEVRTSCLKWHFRDLHGQVIHVFSPCKLEMKEYRYTSLYNHLLLQYQWHQSPTPSAGGKIILTWNKNYCNFPKPVLCIYSVPNFIYSLTFDREAKEWSCAMCQVLCDLDLTLPVSWTILFSCLFHNWMFI